MCVFLCVSEEGQKRALDSLELKFQVMVSCPVWVLGTELTFPERAAHTQLRSPLFSPTFVFLVDIGVWVAEPSLLKLSGSDLTEL